MFRRRHQLIRQDEEPVESIQPMTLGLRDMTYYTMFNTIPPQDRTSFGTVIEVGANGRFERFRQMFPQEMHYVGINLDRGDLRSASEAAGQRKSTFIRENGERLTKNRRLRRTIGEGADFVFDIWSATHYADYEKVIGEMASVTKVGGYVGIAAGAFGGREMRESAREKPDEIGLSWVYHYDAKRRKLRVQGDTSKVLDEIQGDLEVLGYPIRVTDPQRRLEAIGLGLKMVAQQLGLDKITIHDVRHYKKLRKMQGTYGLQIAHEAGTAEAWEIEVYRKIRR